MDSWMGRKPIYSRSMVTSRAILASSSIFVDVADIGPKGVAHGRPISEVSDTMSKGGPLDHRQCPPSLPEFRLPV